MENTIVGCLKNDLVRQFICATQITAINFQNVSNNGVYLILKMLSHPILEKYPLKTPYLTAFLKKIISQMENNENELCDELYLKYTELIQRKSNDGPFYKHYILEKNSSNEFIESVITIQESTSIVSQGTTGLCTWQAGIALGCWYLKNKDKLKDKFIVELGCGTGLSGISACINSKLREYWFTDYHSTVLNTLKHNIQINKRRYKFHCKYDIIQLSWDNIEDLKIFEDKKPDLVIAADVVFDHTMFEPLCNSLKYFVTNNVTEIILFCTIRNLDTFNQFLKILNKNNMPFTQDILPDNYSVVLQQDCPVHIIHVKQNTNMFNNIL